MPFFGLADGLQAEAPAGAELEAELELVAWKTVTAITKDGGVVKKTLKEAEGYKTPNRDAKVKLRGTALLLPAGVDPKRVSEDAPLVAFDKFEEGSELAFTVDEGLPFLCSLSGCAESFLGNFGISPVFP